MTPGKKLQKFTNILYKNVLANLSTIMPDGAPHTSPVWFNYENNLFWVNTVLDGEKDRNMEKNPIVKLSIQKLKIPYVYVVIRGKVIEHTVEGGNEYIDALGKKFLDANENHYWSPIERRIIYKIKPISVLGH